MSSELDIFYETSTGGLISEIPATTIDISFFNCILLTFTSGNHIEINRIRAGYNEPFFDVGVRAFVVQENFTQERRKNTLIHSSGLLNSRTGINYINQFNESEGGLTISLDPLDGSIQKLFVDDTQVIIFQEDKVSRSPVNKNFIYSAEGGAIPVTSNTQFLGTVAAYAGEFGISQDPQSFASYGFAKYFTDKNRGTVLRLSQNGITEIAKLGMGDFFRDALKQSTKIIGSYDEYNRCYELTIIGQGLDSNKDTNSETASEGYITLSFDDRSNGWTSFKGFKQAGGVSLNNYYYTFSGGTLWEHHSENVTHNNFYNSGTQQSYVIPIFNDAPSLVKQYNALSYEGDEGWGVEYIQTDIGNSGELPQVATSYSTTLQLSGAADNSVFNGANTVIAKENEGISWAVFVEPLNSQFEFKNVNDIVLTTATGSNLTVTNPQSITEGKLVFLVQHTVGTSNTVQTLNISGTGASLAFTVALLTVNTIDTVAFSAITPASQIFNNSGSNNVVFSTAAFTNYYIDPANITVNISGMPAVTNPGALTNARTGDNVVYTLPVTVPTEATAGTITINGTATLKYTLTWGQGNVASPGVIATPNGTAVGIAYYNSPFEAAASRTITIAYTCLATEVLTTSSYTDSGVGYPANTSINSVLSNNDGQLTITVVVPELIGDTTATPTITATGAATATLGTTATPQAINQAGDSVVISGTWNVNGSASPSDNWILLNGVNGTAALTPGNSFTIGATENTTGSSRTGTITLATTNTRVSANVPNQVITINQAG